MSLVKRGALLKNERLKLYKKPSTWILIGVIVALSVLGLLLTQKIYKDEGYSYTWQEDYTMQLEQLTMELKSNPDQPSIESQIERFRYLLDNEIPPSDWRADAAAEYFDLKNEVNTPAVSKEMDFQEPMMDAYPQGNKENPMQKEPNPKDTAKNKEQMKKLKSIIENNDWKAYINSQIDALNNGTIPSVNEQEKKVDIEIYNLYLEQEIVPVSKNSHRGMSNDIKDAWKASQVQLIRENKLNLLRGEDRQGALLTHTQRTACQQEIDVALKRLSTNTPSIKANTFLGLLESSSSSLSLVTLLLVVFAGGVIATEYSTGTVKMLLITPHKRQKIFWSKVKLMIEVSFIAMSGIFVLSFLLSGIFTGFDNIGAMQVMTLFGTTVRFPYLVYIVMRYLIMMLPVFVFGALALMMSAITRKTSVAIAVTLLLMFGSNMIMGILAYFTKRFIVPGIKFILFANTSLENYLPSASSSINDSMAGSMTVDSTMTLGFSVVILFVYLICFLWIARDSFCRRDIK